MAHWNIVKFCTAAFAGSLIGVAYERIMHDRTAQAAEHFSRPDHLGGRDQSMSKSSLQTDPLISAENFKNLATFGFPSSDNIRLFDDFIVSYDRRLKQAAWTYEHLTPTKLEPNDHTSRSRSDFVEDRTLHEYFRASPADYHHSGYDRGHMAAAGNHKLRQADVDQTFVLSNIAPQEPTFNREGWNKLEKYVRYRTKQSKNLYVVTGPLFLPRQESNGRYYVKYEVIGSNHVSVPTHFFKVFAYENQEGQFKVEAFLMPNDNIINNKVRLEDYRIPLERLDVIERSAGVIFFDRLPRNDSDYLKSL